jgi:hypothetical protein
VIAISVCLASQASFAEELRIFTAVYDLSAQKKPGEKPPVVARAITLFHAGKVYDYVDLANEVVILEPSARRFRILNPSRGLVATAAFDEIKTHLKVAREETRRQAASLNGTDPESARIAALLTFQLDPRFEETFDEKSGVLELKSGPLTYTAKTADPGRPGVAEEYLDYADWACQLNYLLHPSPVLPEPRLVLNQALRERGRIPQNVELNCPALPSRLRAEHSVNFDLNAQDQNLIFQWESQLKAETTRVVPLREYQKTILTAKAR